MKALRYAGIAVGTLFIIWAGTLVLKGALQFAAYTAS